MTAWKIEQKVLVVSAAETAERLQAVVRKAGFCPAGTIDAPEKLRLEKERPELLVVNVPREDRGFAAAALRAAKLYPAMGVLALVYTEQYDRLLPAAERAGAALVVKPATVLAVRQALCLLRTVTRRLIVETERSAALQERLESEHMVNRAKLLLVERKCMSEMEAHRYIEKQAMDTCRKRLAVAEQIVRVYGACGA